jgi:hypothetical protein
MVTHIGQLHFNFGQVRHDCRFAGLAQALDRAELREAGLKSGFVLKLVDAGWSLTSTSNQRGDGGSIPTDDGGSDSRCCAVAFNASRTARKAPRFESIYSLGQEASNRQEEPCRFQGRTPFDEAVSDSP